MVAVVLVVALHLGLIGTIAGDSKWTGVAADAVLVLIALKIALVVLARLGLRRRAAKSPDGS